MIEVLLVTDNNISTIRLGTMNSGNFITGSDLAAAIGLRAGTAINDDTEWLKFTDPKTGSVRIIPKLPIRHSINHSEFLTRSPADGSKIITIAGDNYRIQLISGATANPATMPPIEGGEYNELYYAVCVARPAEYNGPILANYSLVELGFQQSQGAITLCRENYGFGNNYILRGRTNNFRSISWQNQALGVGMDYGWRPILTKVS